MSKFSKNEIVIDDFGNIVNVVAVLDEPDISEHKYVIYNSLDEEYRLVAEWEIQKLEPQVGDKIYISQIFKGVVAHIFDEKDYNNNEVVVKVYPYDSNDKFDYEMHSKEGLEIVGRGGYGE